MSLKSGPAAVFAYFWPCTRPILCLTNIYESEMAEVTHQSFSDYCLVGCFLSGDATVTIAHRCTPKGQLKELACLADIIVAAAGHFHFTDYESTKL